MLSFTVVMFDEIIDCWNNVTYIYIYGRRAFSVAGPMFWNSLPTRHWTRRGRFQTTSRHVSIFIVLVHSAH